MLDTINNIYYVCTQNTIFSFISLLKYKIKKRSFQDIHNMYKILEN